MILNIFIKYMQNFLSHLNYLVPAHGGQNDRTADLCVILGHAYDEAKIRSIKVADKYIFNSYITDPLI